MPPVAAKPARPLDTCGMPWIPAGPGKAFRPLRSADPPRPPGRWQTSSPGATWFCRWQTSSSADDIGIYRRPALPYESGCGICTARHADTGVAMNSPTADSRGDAVRLASVRRIYRGAGGVVALVQVRYARVMQDGQALTGARHVSRAGRGMHKAKSPGFSPAAPRAGGAAHGPVMTSRR